MRTDIELNLTARLIESITGRSTLLFRPPYGEDIEPETPEQIEPLVRSNSFGYVTVGMRIDPNDWASPTPATIVSRVVEQAEKQTGNIVLLHDSGGDRTNTLLALPSIIRELRARGYEFVNVNSLIPVSKESIMPLVAQNEQMITRGSGFFFQMLHWV